ncbi:MAG: helix-turn-helix transcriptional regulator [Cyanobacteria bacterium P01_G01_bin.54]
MNNTDDLNEEVTVRSLRESSGLSQEQLAARLGKTRNTIADWENGKKIPRLDHAVDLAKALDVEIGLLVRAFRFNK